MDEMRFTSDSSRCCLKLAHAFLEGSEHLDILVEIFRQ